MNPYKRTVTVRETGKVISVNTQIQLSKHDWTLLSLHPKFNDDFHTLYSLYTYIKTPDINLNYFSVPQRFDQTSAYNRKILLANSNYIITYPAVFIKDIDGTGAAKFQYINAHSTRQTIDPYSLLSFDQIVDIIVNHK